MATFDELDALLESNGPKVGASGVSAERRKEIAASIEGATNPREAAANPRAARKDRATKGKDAARPWTKDEVRALKRALKEVPSSVEKNERWRRVHMILGR